MMGIIILLLFIPICFAVQEHLGTFRPDECISLLQSCADCTYVNFTSVIYPNSTQLMGEVEATKTGSIFNHTICNATVVGNYIVHGRGDLGGVDTIFTYDFKITPNGKEESNSPVSLAITIFFIVFNLGLFFLYFTKETLNNNKYANFILKRGLLVITIFFTMFNISIITTLVSASNYDLTHQMYGLMEIVGWAGYLSVIVLLLVSMFQLFAEARNDKIEKRTGDYNG